MGLLGVLLLFIEFGIELQKEPLRFFALLVVLDSGIHLQIELEGRGRFAREISISLDFGVFLGKLNRLELFEQFQVVGNIERTSLPQLLVVADQVGLLLAGLE